MRDEAFGDVPQEAKIQVTKWQGVSFAVGAWLQLAEVPQRPAQTGEVIETVFVRSHDVDAPLAVQEAASPGRIDRERSGPVEWQATVASTQGV